MIPITRDTGSPRRLSRNALITGIPPATAASKRRSTPAESAAVNNSTPTLANNSLLAVTTGFPDANAAVINSRAGSIPPMTSTTRSIVGSATTAWVSRVRSSLGTATSRSRERFRTATAPISREMPVRAAMKEACSCIREYRAAPTLPHPSRPMRTTRGVEWEAVMARQARAVPAQNRRVASRTSPECPRRVVSSTGSDDVETYEILVRLSPYDGTSRTVRCKDDRRTRNLVVIARHRVSIGASHRRCD